MAQLLALALACDQTRVFNVVFSDATSSLRMPGAKETHHMLTHTEQRDPKLGYQPQSTVFVMHSMEALATFLAALEGVREGNGTLLDSCLVLAHSESSDAMSHSVTGLPLLLAGKAGGRVRPGIHVRGGGEPSARVGLTVLQAMGLRVDRFGVRQNEASRPISAVLA
jgi:hypothetical protein